MTWGILAYLATTPRARRYLSALSAVVALGVGLTTVYLGTHWLSDVLLGWAAGLLVLLALPWCEPVLAVAESWILAARDRLRERLRDRRRLVPSLPVASGGPRPGFFPTRPPGPEEPVRDPVREPVGVAGGRRTPATRG